MLCQYTSPQFVNVRFINNYASYGGAVYAGGSIANPTFTDCQFIDNYAAYGGAVYLYYGSATFDHCLFEGSHLTYGSGTAVYSYGVNLDLVCCTFAANNSSGDATLYLYNTTTQLNSSIIAFNTCSAPVQTSGSTTLNVSYSDVYGNSSGDWIDALSGMNGINGNIDLDPLFENVPGDDFHLTDPSPCIDAGDPALPEDPDNTIADMGAFYFQHNPLPLNVWLDTSYHPWYIPQGGGDVTFTARIRNNLDIPVSFDGWSMITTPSGNTFGPLMQFDLWLAENDELVSETLTQNIPGWAPNGEYIFSAYVGLYPETIVDSDHFSIIKFGPGGGQEGSTGDWAELASGWDTPLLVADSDLPESFELSPAYPNPFNATTTVSLTIPSTQRVEVELVDVLGRHVATILSGVQTAGIQRIEVDASELAAGMYLLRAHIEGYQDQVRKIMLIK